MHLEAAQEAGLPILRRLDGGGAHAAVQGGEREYLTTANREKAVDRDYLTAVRTWNELADAEVDATAFTEDEGWGKTTYFPVIWKDWTGVARVQNMDKNDPEEGIGFDLRFRIPENGVEEMIDELLSDLRVDGYRPRHFAMRTWNEEESEGDTFDLPFYEGEGDKYDDQAAMQELLFAAYADGTLAVASASWVQEEEPSTSPGVLAIFSRGTFEAVFIPDGSALME